MSQRLMFVSTGLDTGGAETVLLRLSQRLTHLGTTCGVISLGDEGTVGPELRRSAVPVWCLGLKRPVSWPAALKQIRVVLSTLRPTVVQGWMYHGNLVATVAAALVHPAPPLAWSVRQSLAVPNIDRPMTRLAIRLGALFSRRADAIIYNSSVAREDHEAKGFSSENGTVLPNGFDVSEQLNGNNKSDVRFELRVPDHAALVGHVARAHPAKDHQTFLAAAAVVLRKCPATVFALVGDGVDDRNRGLTNTIATLGLLRNVRLLGRRGDIARLQSAFDVACLSSRAESFPNAIGEAMCAGVPCVSTAVGDVASLIADTGRVVPVGDPDALSAALLDLMCMEPARLKNLGARARQRIVERYSIDSVARQYALLYDRLATARVGRTP